MTLLGRKPNYRLAAAIAIKEAETAVESALNHISEARFYTPPEPWLALGNLSSQLNAVREALRSLHRPLQDDLLKTLADGDQANQTKTP